MLLTCSLLKCFLILILTVCSFYCRKVIKKEQCVYQLFFRFIFSSEGLSAGMTDIIRQGGKVFESFSKSSFRKNPGERNFH